MGMMNTTNLAFVTESRARRPVIPIEDRSPRRQEQVPCADCAAREGCLPAALPASHWEQVRQALCVRQRVRKDQFLHRAGDSFTSLYAIRIGSFKSHVIGEDGRDQMTAIHMRGEIVGTEGIATGRHTNNVIALEDSEVCVIPFSSLTRLMAGTPAAQRWFHKVLGREITNTASMIALLGTGRAEERLAAFLISLSRRFAARGYSPREFNLAVTRQDIGSHLGLSTETVSRAFSRFQRDGLIRVHKQRVQLIDIVQLKKSAGGQFC